METEIISYHESTPDQAATEEGKAAYYNGSGVNPYPRNTNKWYSWLRGWGVAKINNYHKNLN